MGETVQEVLFETRRHVSRPFSPNYPPQQQRNEAARGGLLSYIPFRGFTQLKQKWNGYRQAKRKPRLASLFVSDGGEYLAVASGNQITILVKDNDYQEPVGTFNCGSTGFFTCGTWSESHELLGVADDTDTVYIIKSNGEEITRITKRHLNISFPIIGLFVKDDTNGNKCYLCTFTIFLLNGSFHDIEISKDPSASILSAQPLNNMSMLRWSFQDVICWDYSPELSLFVVVGSSRDTRSISNESYGFCTLSLWRRKKNLQMEPLVFTEFEGSYSTPNDHKVLLTSPKILISPRGNFVATLDMRGCLFTFQFEEDNCSLSKVFVGDSNTSNVTAKTSSNNSRIFSDVVDFTWWADDIVMVAKRNGSIGMFGILSRVVTSENDCVYSMPILERTSQSPGFVFLLEITLLDKSYRSSESKGDGLIEHVSQVRPNELIFSELEWSLISFGKRSVPEIYDKLIRGQRYQSALDFAACHGLEKDEVFKSQWLSSVRGVEEINIILPTIKDQSFILSECVDNVGPTEDAVRNLLSFGLHITDSYRFSELEDTEGMQIWDYRLARLKLLQFRDRLETFLGINMGRFSVQEYSRFRDLPVSKAASVLAESGKIGALNLLFKRHPYSLIPFMLEILASIPETVPIQSYVQLLPGISAPLAIALRDEDWVECEKMVLFINNFYGSDERIQIMTEPILMKYKKFQWPSIFELSSWYIKRAIDIDESSGQLDNCIYLVDFAINKGIPELQRFREDIFYLQQLIYSADNDDDINFCMSLSAWVELPDYEKFKLLLAGVKEDTLIPRLHKKAVPFMKMVHSLNTHSVNEVPFGYLTQDKTIDSFFIRWLKEISTQNKLEMCLVIVEEACRDLANNDFFKNEAEMVDCFIKCIYLCSDTYSWNTMSTVLSKLPPVRAEDIKQRFRLAESHVEAGRLLAYYQVPKPINHFLDANTEEKSAKQIIRLLLSKYIRSQPSRTDHDWANMWRDLQSLQEKAFPLLDLEYMLTEFCRGLLKAGKFSLARNYLKGTSSAALAIDKGENLVIQAAREFFFSAPSLTCPEIWKAKECLNLFPSSRNVRAESDLIDAVTVRLPNLGVNLLPMAFKQIKDPMEIIKLAITGKSGAYLNVDELIEIAKLLGLSAQEDISTVQEMIAREAAIAGDVQLAFDLCLLLAKKGHGHIWDLCAAIARSQTLEKMDSKSQKLLLGFALSHCDEESIGELLHEWKDLDMHEHCETLMMLTGREPSEFSEQTSSNLGNLFGRVLVSLDDREAQLTKVKSLISLVAEEKFPESGCGWESVLRENVKVVSFAASWLSYLHDLSEDTEFGKKLTSSLSPIHVSMRTRAMVTILSWLARNNFTPRDDLVASLAISVMEPPVNDGDDVIGCSILLNLGDALHGVEVIEEQLRTRENYHEFSSLMTMGMIYSLLHNHGMDCENPAQRRELLLRKFKEKQNSIPSDEWNNVHEAQSTFWNEWRVKLEQQMHEADESRVLEKIVPGVETSRFFSGDMDYIHTVVFSLIDSVKLEKKQILKDALIVTHTYGLDHSKVLLYYLSTILVSEVWSVDDIVEEVSHFKEEIFASAGEAIKAISLCVYPEIDGRDKQSLAFIYGFLSDCYMHLKESEKLSLANDQSQTSALGLAQFCKIVGQECSRVSFIKSLDFKNVAGLQDLNLVCFNGEICAQIDENNVDALATMVHNLVDMYGDSAPDGLISWKYVYTHYVLSSLETLERKAESETLFQRFEDLHFFMKEIEQTYDTCEKRIRVVGHPNVLDIVKRFFMVILSANKKLRNFPSDSIGKECVVQLISFWLRLINDLEDLLSLGISDERFCSKCSEICLKVFLSLIDKEMVPPKLGWITAVDYVGYGLVCNISVEIFNFCQAMIFSGCGFETIAHVFSEVLAQLPSGFESTETPQRSSVNVQDLSHVYVSMLENVLQEMAFGSSGHQNINHLVSSLSKMEGNLDNLKRVRRAVWDRMSMFSDNFQMPGHLRVHVLVLMQFISGRKKNLEGLSSDWPSLLLPWEEWDDVPDRNPDPENSAAESTAIDTSSRFTNTLVALKSSQLVSAISPDLEITSEDILSVDSAVSCFLRVAESAVTALHVNTLLAVLSELESLFTSRLDEVNSAEVLDTMDNWSNDDWNEGWESFQDKSAEEETNAQSDLLIHPLHICWMTVIRKMIKLSSHRDILKLLDRNATKDHVLLLDEEDTRNLSQTAQNGDCFLALEIALLMPYEAIQLQCLDAVENKLKEGFIPDNIVTDHFFILILSSGILSTIITKASYSSTFSFLSYLVGNFCHRFKDGSMSVTKNDGTAGGEKETEKMDPLFVKLLFPCFISELVKADQHILAGLMVTRFMHTNTALSLINISEAILVTYLRRQLRELRERGSLSGYSTLTEPLANSITNLRSKLENMIESALSKLRANV